MCERCTAISVAAAAVTPIPMDGGAVVVTFGPDAGGLGFGVPFPFPPIAVSVVLYDAKVHGVTCQSCRQPLAANGACYTCNPMPVSILPGTSAGGRR